MDIVARKNEENRKNTQMILAVNEERLTVLQEFYNKKNVFITGGTGAVKKNPYSHSTDHTLPPVYFSATISKVTFARI